MNVKDVLTAVWLLLEPLAPVVAVVTGAGVFIKVLGIVTRITAPPPAEAQTPAPATDHHTVYTWRIEPAEPPVCVWCACELSPDLLICPNCGTEVKCPTTPAQL